MTTISQSDDPSPVLFFQTATAHMRTAALKTAVELDLFTGIGEGNQTPESLAIRCRVSQRGMRMLLDYLTIAGFLTKQPKGYGLTKDSEIFLTKESPAYLGAALEFMLSAPLVEGAKNLTGAVRKGGSVVSEEGTTAPEHPEWVTFARSMVPLMKGPAEWIALWVSQQTPNTRKVLDVAAGHGMFGVEIAKKVAQAQIMAQDWANVLTVAQETAEAAGVIDRFRTLPGNVFDVDLGEGYDLVLLTNFLHHFDEATCETLLNKIHGTLSDGGKIITLEFIPNEDRISPPEMAEFCLIMLTTTPAGDAYTFSEYERMFQNTGFSQSEMYDVPGSNQRAIITQK